MDTIKFSTNWNNKLNNKAFTTIRLANCNKYKLNRQYAIILKDKELGTATIKDIKTLSVNHLGLYTCYLDTGYNREETINIIKKMYPNLNFSTALFNLILLVYDVQQP